MLKEGMFIQDRYEIISKIGSGGMADVYKAKDHTLNRFVAVKVLKPEFRKDKGFITKFRVEAQSAAGLAHPNIVNVYDVGEDNGISFIVMELVEGITLKEYIEKKGRLAVREATSIAIQVSMGLQAAHNNGIVHRDVKPQNIIIRPDGSLALIDFGISRIYKKGAKEDTVFSGTEEFAAPEQYGFKQTDIRSDIYSYGVVLSYLLTGKAKPIKEPVTPLEKVAARCCAFVPEKRYRDDKSLCRALQKTSRQYRRRKNRIAFASCLAGTAFSFCLAAMAGWYVTDKEGRRVSFREPLIEKAVCAYLGKEEGTVTYKDLNKVLEEYEAL